MKVKRGAMEETTNKVLPISGEGLLVLDTDGLELSFSCVL